LDLCGFAALRDLSSVDLGATAPASGCYAAAVRSDAAPAWLRWLRDPAAELPCTDAGLHAHALLRGRVLEQLSRTLSAAGEEALLVKGAALALTAYPAPSARPMNDVDLLVSERAHDRILATLVRSGCRQERGPGRPFSRRALGETALIAHSGALTFLIEVHTTLDKVVARPVDLDGIFARARAAPGLGGLLVPAPEDHMLLIALHAAGHEFRHTVGFVDLELLMRRGIDFHAVAERAHAWRLGTVLYVALATLRTLGAASIRDEHVRAFDPGPMRRLALSRYYRVGSFPVARGPARSGLAWVASQTPLRDDLGAWSGGVARYAAVRALERLFYSPRAT
jgi:hypothetical protein